MAHREVVVADLPGAVNLTPHDIVIVDFEGKVVLTFPTSGEVARLEGRVETEAVVRSGIGLGFLPVLIDKTGDGHNCYATCNLGRMKDAKNVIVSKMVADAMWEIVPENITIWAPDTGPGSVVRDANGNVIGVKRMLLYGTPTMEEGAAHAGASMEP